MSLIFLRVFFVCACVLQFQIQQLSAHAPVEPIVDKDEDDSFSFLISGGQRDAEKQRLVRFMVSIRSRRPKKYFGDNHFCAGAIIAADAVLTAAHCVMEFVRFICNYQISYEHVISCSKRRVLTRPRHLLIVAGTSRRLQQSTTTEQYEVAAIRAHPDFFYHGTTDLAVIRIKGNFTQNNISIEILSLATESPRVGDKCSTIGWGRIYWNGPLSDVTMNIEVTIFTLNECKTMFPKHFDVGMLCAGNPEDYTEEPCQGDSGGPLICGSNLTAIVARNNRCGESYLPGLYTNVYHHLAWIQKVLNGARSRLVRLPTYAAVVVFCLWCQ